jgi:hypothetical protein
MCDHGEPYVMLGLPILRCPLTGSYNEDQKDQKGARWLVGMFPTRYAYD